MKRITLLSIIMLVVALGVSACDSFLSDLHDDPNNPLDVPENLQLPALQSNFSYEIIANTAVRTPAHWIQQLAYSGVVPSLDNYDVDESDVNNLWEFWAYTDVLKNANVLINQASENDNHHHVGVAKVIKAWTLSIVTDLWGEAPLSEAFQPLTHPSPAYDTQAAIYDSVFVLLDQAIADLDRESDLALNASSDLLYGGDTDQWKKLAYTLKGRFHMRLSKAPGHDEASQAQQALDAFANGFESTQDDAEFAYFASGNSENPWYQWVIDGKWDTRNQLSAHYVNLLKELEDPRLFVQARQVGAVDNNGLVAAFSPEPFSDEHFDVLDSTYVGQENGEDGDGATNVSSIGAFYSAPDAPLTWISYASMLFTRAEATLITQGAGAAQTIYEDAIRAHMEKLNVADADIDAYIAARPALTDGGEDAIVEIMTQKYIANFINYEAYNDWRRTGYPELEPVRNEARIDIIPLRFPYPSSELARNADNIPEYVPLGFDAMKVPVWWDTTVPPGALPNQ